MLQVCSNKPLQYKFYFPIKYSVNYQNEVKITLQSNKITKSFCRDSFYVAI